MKTGIMTVTTNIVHNMDAGEYIKFDDNSLTFTCTKDGNATEHRYPRATDPAAGKWLKVLSTGLTTYTFQTLYKALGLQIIQILLKLL